MLKPFLYYPRHFLLVMIMAIACLAFFMLSGNFKAHSEIQVIDVIGEGLACLLTLLWIYLILKSRPRGYVTRYFYWGLTFVFLALWMDVLDEFIAIPKTLVWDDLMESFTTPIGFIVLTIAMVNWHKEQLVLSRKLQTKEHVFRDHRLFDAITPLADAQYFKQQLQHEINQRHHSAKNIHLMMINIKDLSAINREFGFDTGNQVLSVIAQTISLNIRPCDLVCRLAGDKFILMLLDLADAQVEIMARELQKCIQSQIFYTHQDFQKFNIDCSYTISEVQQDSPATEIQKLYKQMKHQQIIKLRTRMSV